MISCVFVHRFGIFTFRVGTTLVGIVDLELFSRLLVWSRGPGRMPLLIFFFLVPFSAWVIGWICAGNGLTSFGGSLFLLETFYRRIMLDLVCRP